MVLDRLKKCREEKGLSQAEMGQALEITRQAYNHYETGKREPPQDTLKKISEVLNVSVDYLLGRTDNKTNDDISFDDFTYAMYNESKELTDDQKDMLLSMAKTFKEKLKRDGKI